MTRPRATAGIERRGACGRGSLSETSRSAWVESGRTVTRYFGPPRTSFASSTNRRSGAERWARLG